MRKLMLGTDPEIVAVATDPLKLKSLGLDERLLNLPMPGYFALPIHDPLTPDLDLPAGDVGPDGGATEFRVVPTTDVRQMVYNVRENLRAISTILSDHSGTTISLVSRYYMHPSYISRLDRSYGKACSLQELGCDPDFSVYGVDVPERPDPVVYPYRTLGGHVHVELGKEFMLDRAATAYFVAGLDLLIGAASTYLCTSEEAFLRKEMYGWAGMVRRSDDGTRIEYRTLPAQALIQTPGVCELMFEATQQFAGYMLDIYESVPQPEALDTFSRVIGDYSTLMNTIVPAINAHDGAACRELQTAFRDRLSGCDTIVSVINELQRADLPADFALHGWE